MSSPQWWSGRSMTAHIALDLLSLIWGCITSQPANVSQNVLYWHFRQPPTGWLKFERDTFRSRSGAFTGPWGLGYGALRKFLLAIYYKYGLSLTGCELFSWLQKPFLPPVRSSVRPSDPDTMANTALEVTASLRSAKVNCAKIVRPTAAKRDRL